MAIWNSTVQTAVTIAVIVLIAYILVMWIGALVWTYRDIRARTRDQFSQVIAVMVVLVFNLPGILLYMVLRPKETLAELYDRRLGSEALLQEIQEQETCPTCRRRVEPAFVACPYCRTTLRVACERCGKALLTIWVLCPYCAADRAFAPPAPPATDAGIAADGRERPAMPSFAPPPARRASTATYTPPAPKPAPADPAEGS
ncbi:MAG: zinc ribbon domain-containing protein [Dehalococcoidia bacterium]